MRQIFLILVATGCAYQDDDTWSAVDKACKDAAWTGEGWDAEGLPEPLASDTACQDVLAKHTGADALPEKDLVVRDQIVWSAWTLALAPMAGPVPGDAGAGAALAWGDGGQSAIYEEVVQRLAEAEGVAEQTHTLTDGVWGAVRGLDSHAHMLPLMVHEAAHYRRNGHDPCAQEDQLLRECDPTWDSPTGWEGAVATLLYNGLEIAEDESGVAGRMATVASNAAEAIQEVEGFDPPDEGDDGDSPPEGIE